MTHILSKLWGEHDNGETDLIFNKKNNVTQLLSIILTWWHKHYNLIILNLQIGYFSFLLIAMINECIYTPKVYTSVHSILLLQFFLFATMKLTCCKVLSRRVSINNHARHYLQLQSGSMAWIPRMKWNTM